MTAIRVRCLCRAVQIETIITTQEIHACHCQICRTWGSSPWMAASCGQLTIIGAEQLQLYAFSQWAERGFCKLCGSHLFYRSLLFEHCEISAGLLDTLPNLHLALQECIESKPHYYTFANQTEYLSSAELLQTYKANAQTDHTHTKQKNEK